MSKKIVVIGAGVSGQGLAFLASEMGYEVFVSDKKVIPDEVKKSFSEKNIAFEESHSEKVFENTEAILLSSGLPLNLPVILEAEKRNIKMIGELDFVLPNIKSEKLICVTGSNGKSTVTALTGHILNRAGYKAGTGGNLGTASATFTKEFFDYIVLELSSFQLERATKILNSNVSIITNLAPDHIDWHGSYENYVAAKAKILSLRGNENWGIIQDRDVEMLNPSGKIITLSWNEKPVNKFSGHIFMDKNCAWLIKDEEKIKIFNYDDTTLIGSHNFENVAMSLCAYILVSGNKNFNVKNLLEGFKPLPHRCEKAGELNGVIYIDDSKGTNVAASVTAMESINLPKIVILGGQGKGEDYTPLAEAVKRECESAILLGTEAEKIESALLKAGFKNIFRISESDSKAMETAVNKAYEIAKPGMCVLLSPACTSWDMYTSYKKRGEHFCRLVQEKISECNLEK